MPRQLARTVALGLLVSLAAMGCGGGDGDDASSTTTAGKASSASSSGDAEEFCLAIDEVKIAGQRLSEVTLEDDSDVPEAKEALSGLIDALDAALEVAPEEISDITDEVAGFTAQVDERVQSAETAAQLRDEIPLLVSVLAENTSIDDEAQAEFATFVRDSCGL